MLARRGNHFLHRKSSEMQAICERGLHHVPRRAPVQADDLQNDLLLRLRQRALLVGHFQQLLYSASVRRRRGRPRCGASAEDGGVDPSARRGAAGRLNFCRKTSAAAPRATPIAPARAPPASWGTPRTPPASAPAAPSIVHGQQPVGVKAIRRATASMAALANVLPSTSVASRSCGCASSSAIILPAPGTPLRQLPHLPFAQGKERRFRQRKEETRAGKNQYGGHGQFHRLISYPKTPRIETSNSEPPRPTLSPPCRPVTPAAPRLFPTLACPQALLADVY